LKSCCTEVSAKVLNILIDIIKPGENMRKAQAAIEYLMMITVALIMVAIVIKYVKQAAEQTGKTINESAKKIAKYVNESMKNITG
jgi:uncharacterized protein (UPF0333 family)